MRMRKPASVRDRFFGEGLPAADIPSGMRRRSAAVRVRGGPECGETAKAGLRGFFSARSTTEVTGAGHRDEATDEADPTQHEDDRP